MRICLCGQSATPFRSISTPGDGNAARGLDAELNAYIESIRKIIG